MRNKRDDSPPAMLLTLDLHKKKDEHLFRLFAQLWKEAHVECSICFDRIGDDGLVIVSDHATLNLEKMFHVGCFERWTSTAASARGRRDPFNRNVKFKFNFPPKTMTECASLLREIRGFIGEESVDKVYSFEYERIHNEKRLDLELDLMKLLKY
uniref:Ac53-like protein n=1 Tax=Lymantria dispar multicapsid nuclear polyhedrosis virus TaxID=10449 RepID=A0A1B1MQS9_NPVLD|nr:ac53-like protein [Lymantria dispar multiple nucleopolyhedrovirus]